ncbi:MAG: DUF4358 domain-containing protein [Clostridia bacterium]|nr:DUF4358 domain-containing protein [Clostridia bacterium]
MKRFEAALIAAILIISLAACGKSETEPAEATEATEATEFVSEEESIPAEEETEEIIVTNEDEKAKEEEKIEEPEPEEADDEVDLEACKEEMISSLELTDVAEIGASRLLDLYGIKSEWVKTSASFAAASGAAFPMEIIMIEAVDEDAAEQIYEKLKTRVSDIYEQASSYDPDSAALAKKCPVSKDGVYVSMLFSEKYADMQTIYENAIK